jgi:glyoxylase-like metal-dependent hydrolase (beta-lactamase superfamily II)
LLFAGDTIFVDSIGRPDLRDKAEEFAENLYNTIQQKIMKLPDDIVILQLILKKMLKQKKF